MRRSAYFRASSQLYHSFDQVLLLSHGRALYSGPGGFAPATHFSQQGISYHEGYNVADYLLEIASDPPVALFQAQPNQLLASAGNVDKEGASSEDTVNAMEKGYNGETAVGELPSSGQRRSGAGYATTFLTQLEVLSGREWKILRRLAVDRRSQAMHSDANAAET